MITFSYLNKAEKDAWLPLLFDLLYDNMVAIAPSTLSYEDEKAQWLSNVSPALDKTPRQIILCFFQSALAGYIQYYIRDRILMVEELQLKKDYQKTTVFLSFFRYLHTVLPENMDSIEAYADKRNIHSQRLMAKLGMAAVDDEADVSFVRFRGTTAIAKAYFKPNTRNGTE